MAGGEIAEREVADADAQEAERGMAHGGGHAADLAVFAFDELEREPGVRDGFADADGGIAWRKGGWWGEKADAAGERAEVAEVESAAAEARERIRRWNTFDLGPVFAAVGVLGIEQAGIEAGFVAEEEEAFGIGVEAAEGVNVFGEREVSEGAPAGAGLGRELGEDAVRFV